VRSYVLLRVQILSSSSHRSWTAGCKLALPDVTTQVLAECVRDIVKHIKYRQGKDWPLLYRSPCPWPSHILPHRQLIHSGSLGMAVLKSVDHSCGLFRVMGQCTNWHTQVLYTKNHMQTLAGGHMSAFTRSKKLRLSHTWLK
jgi:hypothetical protein